MERSTKLSDLKCHLRLYIHGLREDCLELRCFAHEEVRQEMHCDLYFEHRERYNEL